jgi:hypothetical protein
MNFTQCQTAGDGGGHPTKTKMSLVNTHHKKYIKILQQAKKTHKVQRLLTNNQESRG